MNEAIKTLYRRRLLACYYAVVDMLQHEGLYEGWWRLVWNKDLASTTADKYMHKYIASLPPEKVTPEITEAVAAYVEAGKQYQAVSQGLTDVRGERDERRSEEDVREGCRRGVH